MVLHPAGAQFEFSDKRRVLAEYLTTVDGAEIVVFTDAYDTLFLRGQNFIETAYARFGKRIVFSGEPNSWPLGAIGMALHPHPPAGRFPYLNSGGFIGPAGDIARLLRRYQDPPVHRFETLTRLRAHGYDTDQLYGWSDQYFWTLVRLLEQSSIGVDQDGTLFHFLGPRIPDVVHREVMRDVHDFYDRGRAAASYRRERERLPQLLTEPSGAAQLHFAGSVTKAVALDLLDEGSLPGWLTDHCRAPRVPAPSVEA